MVTIRELGLVVLLASAVALMAQSAPSRAEPPAANETEAIPEPPSLFPTPASLEPAVAFWVDIFSTQQNDRVVLHDRENLLIVWQIVELPELADGSVDEAKARTTVDDAIGALAARLKRLHRTPEPNDEYDAELLRRAKAGGTGALDGAWHRVRGQRGIADRFGEGIERAKPWLAQLRGILKDERIPEELIALPFIESGFNPTARSSAGAAGLWQLMPATARQFGLRVNTKIDQRLDVVKSTRAAARMLRDNHAMLHNWPLAITGYNHGPYGIKRAVKALGSSDLSYLIKHYDKRSFGFASKNFYAEFLAAKQVLEEVEAAALSVTADAVGVD